jgi:uncharacterized damage-inducible protein DinB
VDAVNLIQRLHQHRAWVNGNLLDAAAQLSDAQLRTTYPIGQGSIWKSLVHLYAAEYVWLETLLGDERPVAPGDLPGMIPGNQQGPSPITSLVELRQQWTTLDQRWLDYLTSDSLNATTLEDLVPKVVSATGVRFVTRRSDILLHVCTHSQYTTAQIMNMFRQTGLTPLPEVMLIALARQDTR